MVHVFRLGPLEVGGRKAYAYCGLDPDGGLIPPEITHTDAKGLGALAKRYAGQPLRCEPDLAEAARPFGFEPAPHPETALLPRATLAYGLALGPMAGRPELDVLTRFLEACAAFWTARPWELLGSDDPLPVALTERGRTRKAEASVMGAAGQEFGVALYDEPGSIRRVAALVTAGRMKETRGVSALAVTFDEEPAWAATALDGAFGLPRLPVPIRVRKGKGGPATTEELLDAAALLEAVAELSGPDDAEHAEVTVEAGGRAITARVALPDEDGEPIEDLAEPMLVPEPIPATGRSKTPRNAPCPCGSGRKYKKCHLAEEEARAHARRLAERDPIHALDERITADALALARRRWGRRFDPDGALARLGLDYECTQALLGWSSDHYRSPDGRPRSTSTSRSAAAASTRRAARSSERSARHASATTRSSPPSREGRSRCATCSRVESARSRRRARRGQCDRATCSSRAWSTSETVPSWPAATCGPSRRERARRRAVACALRSGSAPRRCLRRSSARRPPTGRSSGSGRRSWTRPTPAHRPGFRILTARTSSLRSTGSTSRPGRPTKWSPRSCAFPTHSEMRERTTEPSPSPSSRRGTPRAYCRRRSPVAPFSKAVSSCSRPTRCSEPTGCVGSSRSGWGRSRRSGSGSTAIQWRRWAKRPGAARGPRRRSPCRRRCSRW